MPLRARGSVWRKKDRAAGIVLHISINTEVHWTRSGWHGWVYGWKLHLLVTVAPAVWISLTADLTPSQCCRQRADPHLAGGAGPATPVPAGDRAYHDPALREPCWARQWTTVTTRRDAYPHTDQGVKVCRVFHHLRTHAIENFNGQFKAIFDCGGQVATRAWWPLDASRSGQSLSINSPSSTVPRPAARCVLVSSHSSSLLEDL